MTLMYIRIETVWGNTSCVKMWGNMPLKYVPVWRNVEKNRKKRKTKKKEKYDLIIIVLKTDKKKYNIFLSCLKEKK